MYLLLYVCMYVTLCVLRVYCMCVIVLGARVPRGVVLVPMCYQRYALAMCGRVIMC